MEIERELVLTELPFDQYQRYKVVEDIATTIKDLTGRERLKVLDVGGSPGLIGDFLPSDDTIVLDILRCDRPNSVQGDGRDAPFGDGSFDLVTCLDTLEHVPRESRKALVLELLRVSRDFIIIIAPFADENVELAEQILNEFIRQTLKAEHEQLKEHLAYGLPRLGDIVQ
ncbi:MAG: class I SAM-dependent methyltransferase, partial [Candidatus Bipolaricaulia bacterium]